MLKKSLTVFILSFFFLFSPPGCYSDACRRQFSNAYAYPNLHTTYPHPKCNPATDSYTQDQSNTQDSAHAATAPYAAALSVGINDATVQSHV